MNTPKTNVTVVDTGIANVASVCAALTRIGVGISKSHCAQEIATAQHVILPGVGAFAAGMENLCAHDLINALRIRITTDRPTLCICLGLQLLTETSEESPGVRGLEILPLQIRRFQSKLPIPHIGWNAVRPEPSCRFVQPGHAYFANSYCLGDAPLEWSSAWSDYGQRFVAALERGNVLACQFHPELSGPWGLRLLNTWIEETN